MALIVVTKGGDGLEFDPCLLEVGVSGQWQEVVVELLVEGLCFRTLIQVPDSPP